MFLLCVCNRLCPDGMYDYAVDIWSCGCILAEMLKRDPFFPGKNFVQQLTLVFDVIGSPKPQEVQHIINNEARQFLQEQKHKQKVPFSRIFPQASKEIIELLESFLIFHPPTRCTVDQALESAFLAPLLSPTHPMETASSLTFPPVNLEAFEFSFERQNLSRLQLKNLIHQEVASFKKEKYGHAHSKKTAATSSGPAVVATEKKVESSSTAAATTATAAKS